MFMDVSRYSHDLALPHSASNTFSANTNLEMKMLISQTVFIHFIASSGMDNEEEAVVYIVYYVNLYNWPQKLITGVLAL